MIQPPGLFYNFLGDFEMLFMYSGVAMAIVSRLPLLLKRFTIEVCALLVGKKSQKCILTNMIIIMSKSWTASRKRTL